MKQPAIALDQLLNCFVWARGEGFGMADETLSARAWRLRYRVRSWGRFQRALDRVFGWLGDPDHCQSSYISELQRRQLPAVYR